MLSSPELAEHREYLAENGVLAMSELALEATLREYRQEAGGSSLGMVRAKFTLP